MDNANLPGFGGRNPIFNNGPSASGPSPLELDYQVDLSTVPPNVIIVSAFTNYTASGVNPQVTDNGGSGFPRINWSDDAVRSLNASMLPNGTWPTDFGVSAVLTFSVFPSGRLEVQEFEVEFIVPVPN